MTWLVEGASSFLQVVVLQYLQSLLVASTDPSIYTQCCTCCSVCVVSLSCLCLLVCAAAVHQPPHARRHEVHRRAGCSQAHAGRRGESAAAAGAAMRCYELVNEYYNRHVCQQRGCIRPAGKCRMAKCAISQWTPVRAQALGVVSVGLPAGPWRLLCMRGVACGACYSRWHALNRAPSQDPVGVLLSCRAWAASTRACA